MKVTFMRQERIINGWSQEFVANKIGTTKQSIQRIETLQRKPSYDVLVKLEDLFKLSHRQLFAVVDETPNSK